MADVVVPDAPSDVDHDAILDVHTLRHVLWYHGRIGAPERIDAFKVALAAAFFTASADDFSRLTVQFPAMGWWMRRVSEPGGYAFAIGVLSGAAS